jgi:multiple sugar transport system ATP-binding protein
MAGDITHANGAARFRSVKFDVALPAAFAKTAPGPTTLGIRPEHLGIGGDDGGNGAHPSARIVVNLTEPLGGESFVYGTLESGEPLTIKQPGQIFIKAGATIAAGIEPGLCHLFDPEGQALAATSRQQRPALVAGEA